MKFQLFLLNRLKNFERKRTAWTYSRMPHEVAPKPVLEIEEVVVICGLAEQIDLDENNLMQG